MAKASGGSASNQPSVSDFLRARYKLDAHPGARKLKCPKCGSDNLYVFPHDRNAFCWQCKGSITAVSSPIVPLYDVLEEACRGACVHLHAKGRLEVGARLFLWKTRRIDPLVTEALGVGEIDEAFFARLYEGLQAVELREQIKPTLKRACEVFRQKLDELKTVNRIGCITFPYRDAYGRVCSIKIRNPEKKQFAHFKPFAPYKITKENEKGEAYQVTVRPRSGVFGVPQAPSKLLRPQLQFMESDVGLLAYQTHALKVARELEKDRTVGVDGRLNYACSAGGVSAHDYDTLFELCPPDPSTLKHVVEGTDPEAHLPLYFPDRDASGASSVDQLERWCIEQHKGAKMYELPVKDLEDWLTEGYASGASAVELEERLATMVAGGARRIPRPEAYLAKVGEALCVQVLDIVQVNYEDATLIFKLAGGDEFEIQGGDLFRRAAFQEQWGLRFHKLIGRKLADNWSDFVQWVLSGISKVVDPDETEVGRIAEVMLELLSSRDDVIQVETRDELVSEFRTGATGGLMLVLLGAHVYFHRQPLRSHLINTHNMRGDRVFTKALARLQIGRERLGNGVAGKVRICSIAATQLGALKIRARHSGNGHELVGTPRSVDEDLGPLLDQIDGREKS